MIAKLLKTIENLSSNKNYTTSIPLLQTTASIMTLKLQDQRTHIRRHRRGTYYRQPLIQQQLLIMGDRLT